MVKLLSLIGNHKAVEAFAMLSIETQQECLEAANAQTMLRFVEHMEPDDRVDLLKTVDDDAREAIMPLIAQAERNEIRNLWHYEEGTAGAVMTTEYAMLPQHLTVATALEKLRLQAPNKETIYYIYITDAERHLIGTISLRELIMSKPSAGLDAIMETHVISVTHDLEVAEVAAVISKYDLLAVPVVDKENRLVGIVTVDDVLDIIEAESTEDFQRISAVMPFDEEYFKRPLHRLFWSRFIWLAILLFTSLISTTIMELNAGVINQMMAYFRVYIQDRNVMLGCIVAMALLATLMTANLIGALMPLVLKKINLDPALTAGPFIATIIDALGIAIYFEIAFVLMRVF
ncbi:MAG: magnesium transporter, partial [Desulfatitalea sp.]|nr:magnesium transporter [Desulfatitalea sp.]